MKIVNMTFEIEEHELVDFENWARYHLDKVIDFKVVPNTSKMYSENEHFKKLVKAKKSIMLDIDRYINEHNYKYNDI